VRQYAERPEYDRYLSQVNRQYLMLYTKSRHVVLSKRELPPFFFRVIARNIEREKKVEEPTEASLLSPLSLYHGEGDVSSFLQNHILQ